MSKYDGKMVQLHVVCHASTRDIVWFKRLGQMVMFFSERKRSLIFLIVLTSGRFIRKP